MPTLTPNRHVNQPISPTHGASLMAQSVREWRSRDRARVMLRARGAGEYEGAEGVIQSIVDDSAWVEFHHGNTEYHARIPLHRLTRPRGDESPFVAVRDALQRDVAQYGGVLVTADCRECGASIVGHVVIDPGEPASEAGPAVSSHLYVASFGRSCNCNSPRADIERDLIVAAAFSEEA